ncbi:MAG: hypothetical protein WC042_01435 [Candidatus Paceibacterota bacterium]|jgi:hypothetical protein|nr:hypothetical protein [Candidatus Paceibacterota bacterium]MDD3548783.1 hypothetical protein [Candidatus Paceibacterota bacterium]MDD4999262.1 hypothetical protein [Candidatus Paceibacterota bacterium]MDD5545433.1 hypothetical protein [Candidatus Paceibacterota bacterium]
MAPQLLSVKKDSFFSWTNHAQNKLLQYNLSESRVKRIIRNPGRIEAGIAPNTIAAMQKAGSKKHPYEIWVMYEIKSQKLKNKKIIIISAWKYPGTTKPGEPIPIPPDIFEEIMISLEKTSPKAKSER